MSNLPKTIVYRSQFYLISTEKINSRDIIICRTILLGGTLSSNCSKFCPLTGFSRLYTDPAHVTTWRWFFIPQMLATFPYPCGRFRGCEFLVLDEVDQGFKRVWDLIRESEICHLIGLNDKFEIVGWKVRAIEVFIERNFTTVHDQRIPSRSKIALVDKHRWDVCL